MTPEQLTTIRALADLLGLPDGLRLRSRAQHYEVYWFMLDLHDRDLAVANHIGLAAFVAYAEAEAEKRFGLYIERHYCEPLVWAMGESFDPGTGARPYTPGDTASRLLATAEALLDGVRAVKGEQP